MAGDGWITPSNINNVLNELDEYLAQQNQHVEMYIAGGARMVLGLTTDRKTKDIDGIIRRGRDALQEAAQAVGERRGIAPGWVNEDMWTAIPRQRDSQEQTVYKGKNLTIQGASPEHMLAMKLRGTRDIDEEDTDEIIRHLGVKDTGHAFAIAERVYQTDGNRARLEILKGIERLAERRPDIEITHRPLRPTEKRGHAPEKKAGPDGPTENRNPNEGTGKNRDAQKGGIVFKQRSDGRFDIRQQETENGPTKTLRSSESIRSGLEWLARNGFVAETEIPRLERNLLEDLKRKRTRAR